MPELLAALCSVMLATVAVASSASSASPKTAAQKPAAQAPARKAEPTPFEKAWALKVEIDGLAGAEDPSATIAKRIELLAGADALCDAADAAAKDSDAASQAFDIRWKLAKRAYDLEAWSIASGLYTTIVEQAIKSRGPEAPATLEAKRLWAASASSLQRSKPLPERKYEPAIDAFRGLVGFWDAKLEQALKVPGEGPLSELYSAAEAHESLGLTLIDASNSKEGIGELKKAHELMCDNVTRLGDPTLLWKVCGDLSSALSMAETIPVVQRTLGVARTNFPGSLDILLSLRGDLAADLDGLDPRNALKEAHDILFEAENVEGTEVLVHALRMAGAILSYLQLPSEAEHALRRAVNLARELRLPRTNVIHAAASEDLGGVLIALGRYKEAIEIFDGEPDLVFARGGRARAKEASGDLDGAMVDFKQRLDSLMAGVVTPQGWQAPEYYLGYVYETRREIGYLQILAGQASSAITSLEELCAEVRRSPNPRAGSSGLAADLDTLATAREAAGDLRGGYRCRKEAFELARQSTPAAGELFLQAYRTNLGWSAFIVGHYEEAERLAREARSAYEHLQRQDLLCLPDVNLAEVLAATERWAEAEKFAEEGLSLGKSAQLKDPFSMGVAQAVLGAVALGKKDPKRAAGLLRDGIKAMESAPPNSARGIEVAYYRGKLLYALGALDDSKAMHDEIGELAFEAQERFESLSTFSARERGEIVSGMLQQAEQVAALQEAHPASLEEESLFEWLSSLRAASGPIELGRDYDTGTEIGKLWNEALRARRHVAALSFQSYASSSPEGLKLFAQAVSDSDAAQHALLKRLPPEHRFQWLTTKFLAVLLRRQSAIGVSIHRIRALPPLTSEDRYVAFVLDGGEKLRLVQLGPAAPIEEMIRDWRQAVTQDRGRPVSKGEPDVLRTRGDALRAAVLDPVLKGATEKRVFLCLDDALHTIPWDALPAAPPAKAAESPVAKSDSSGKQGTPSDGKGGAADPKSGSPGTTNGAPEARAAPAATRGPASPAQENRLVGDDYRIAELPSFRDLIVATQRKPRQPTLLAIGGIEYSARGEGAKQSVSADRPMRGSSEIFGPYDPLVYSAEEVDGIALSFKDTQKRDAVLLKGERATKKALFEQSPKATFLHISTHGYFAPEDIPALGGAGQSPMLEAVTGFAPLSLCGLALAGANSDVGALDEVTGIVTAEELAGLDLSACQLAVLSGCKTDIGVRRAGQDLASLKSALHAAGAANVVASLWRVPDDKTSELMRRFYSYLWKEGLSPDEALWRAKSSFRNELPAVWAGWVFSGVPEGK